MGGDLYRVHREDKKTRPVSHLVGRTYTSWEGVGEDDCRETKTFGRDLGDDQGL